MSHPSKMPVDTLRDAVDLEDLASQSDGWDNSPLSQSLYRGPYRPLLRTSAPAAPAALKSADVITALPASHDAPPCEENSTSSLGLPSRDVCLKPVHNPIHGDEQGASDFRGRFEYIGPSPQLAVESSSPVPASPPLPTYLAELMSASMIRFNVEGDSEALYRQERLLRRTLVCTVLNPPHREDAEYVYRQSFRT